MVRSPETTKGESMKGERDAPRVAHHVFDDTFVVTGTTGGRVSMSRNEAHLVVSDLSKLLSAPREGSESSLSDPPGVQTC